MNVAVKYEKVVYEKMQLNKNEKKGKGKRTCVYLLRHYLQRNLKLAALAIKLLFLVLIS
jgi:hypothetical protein